jgi:hypothetical protein
MPARLSRLNPIADPTPRVIAGIWYRLSDAGPAPFSRIVVQETATWNWVGCVP